MRDWQLLRRRVQIGDAVWCLLQHDGTSPAQPRQCKNKREGGGVRSRVQRSTLRERRCGSAH
jgi:hypothetical protein